MIWAASAEAAEELASRLLGVDVRKALDPLNPGQFLIINEQIGKALDNAVKGGEHTVINKVLGELDVDWNKMSAEAVDKVVHAANTQLGKFYDKVVLPKVSETFEVHGPKVMQSSRSSLIRRQKLDIETDLAQRDLDAEIAIRRSQVNFVRNTAGERVGKVSAKAREIVARGMAEGVGPKTLANDLRKHFRREIPQPSSYWHTVAASYIGRARSTSQIYAFEDGGVETYEVVAVIDEVTTDQCRYMNGKIFSVKSARGLLDQLNTLENPEDVKYANPWIRKGKDKDGNSRLFVPHADGSTTTIAKITRSGVGTSDDVGEFSRGKSAKSMASLGVQFPPYHGRCRTIVVAGPDLTDDDDHKVLIPGAEFESSGESEEG